MVVQQTLFVHQEPLLQSNFSSTYDTHYQVPHARYGDFGPARPTVTGFLTNRPLHWSLAGSFAGAVSVARAVHSLPDPMSISDLARLPVQKKNTAHVRAVAGHVPLPSAEFQSTARASFAPPGSRAAPLTAPTAWLYGGSEATKFRPDFLAIPYDDDDTKTRQKSDGSFIPVAPRRLKNIRYGLHTTPNAKGDWHTTSEAFEAHPAQRMAPRDALRWLSGRRDKRVFPPYKGLEPQPSNEGGLSEARDKFRNPKVHPEPAGSKPVPLEDRTIMSWHPTDTAAKEAVDSMWLLGGSLVDQKPPLVHPSVWRIAQQRDKQFTVGPDPHASKHGRRSRTQAPLRTRGSAVES